jgi:hypothetical protein
LLFVRRAAFICRRQSIRRAVVKVIEVHCQISIQIQSRSNGSARAGAGRCLLPRPVGHSHCLSVLLTRRFALTSSQPMDPRDPHYISGSESDADYAHRPLKRARQSPTSDHARTNGRTAIPSSVLPPLSLSILGVEPLDEFIREVADFVHHLISTRPADLQGEVEVEAKIGVLRERETGNRLQLPILVETSIVFVALSIQGIYHSCQSLLREVQTAASSLTCLK